MDNPKPDLVVIGSGPAGMSAAITAATGGAQVTIIDEQAGPGGQVYRAITRANPERANLLGSDYLAGRPLADGLKHQNIHIIIGATVWQVDEDATVSFSVGGHGRQLQGQKLIIATGALERPVPLPGWTKLGVMSAGAAQILLKSSGLCVNRAVLVGAGPLLLLLAQQLIRAGAPPIAIIETQNASNYWRAARHLAGGLRGWRYLAKGAAMINEIRKASVPRYTGATDISLEGQSSLTAVRFSSGGQAHRINCAHALLHQGVVPNTQISRSLGIEHLWDSVQNCFKPEVDDWGRTGLSAILIAGDGAGIMGAAASALSGQLSALTVLASINGQGRIEQHALEARARPIQARLRKELAIRPLLDILYAPPAEVLTPADATIICRCEDITAGDIRRYASLGCVGPNQTKAFGRPGMGPCQGRYCGLTVTNLLAQANATSPQQVGYYRIRAPLKPITVGELADLADD